MELLILSILLLYPLFMERKWQKDCYKERGEKKCGGVYGGKGHDNRPSESPLVAALGGILL